MAHDKIRAAALKRMAETGEPYAAARRAVAAEHQAAGDHSPPAGAGCTLAMSGEIRDWLAGLRGSDPAAARVVGQALAALMNEGAGLGAPLAVSTAGSWPWALAEALDRSYQESLARLTPLRWGAADAASLVKEIQDQAAELKVTQARLAELHRRASDSGRPQEAAHAAATLAAAQRQADEVRRLLPGMIKARNELAEASQRGHAHAEALRARKDVLKARYTAAHSSLLAQQAIGAAGPAGAGGREQDEAISAAEARLLRDVIAQLERELGQQPWPEGLMELRPGAAGDTAVRILFAIEPPGTALLIAVLDGPEAIQDQRLEAILLSADTLRRVRSGQEPEAAAHGCPGTRSFLAEFYPGPAADPPGASAPGS